MTYSKFKFEAEPERSRSGTAAEPELEPTKFRSKGAGVAAIKGKWPAPEPESELRSFENLAQEPEPLKFIWLYQQWRSKGEGDAPWGAGFGGAVAHFLQSFKNAF